MTHHTPITSDSPVLSTHTVSDSLLRARQDANKRYMDAFRWYHSTKKHVALVSLRAATMERLRVGA